MKKLLTFLLMLVVGIGTSWGDDKSLTEIELTPSSGTYYKGTTKQTSAGFCNKWVSTPTGSEPAVTIYSGANNNLYSGGTSVFKPASGSGCTYTISVPEGYIISGYSFTLSKNTDTSWPTTTTATTISVDGTKYSVTSSSEAQNITSTACGNSVAFVAGGTNKCVEISNLKIKYCAVSTSNWSNAYNWTKASIVDNGWVPGNYKPSSITAPYGSRGWMHFEKSGEQKIFFNWQTGSNKLNITGVDVLNEKGKVVASDYHEGSTGTSNTNNSYTLNIPAAGDYQVRYFYNPESGFSSSTGVIAYSQTTYPITSSEVITLLKNTAKPLLEDNSVGTPSTSSTEYTTLNSAYNNSTIILDNIVDYIACTDVTMPTNNKGYTLTMVANNDAKTNWALVANGTSLTPTSGGTASTFYVHKFTNKNSNERYAFISSDGKVIGYRELTSGYTYDRLVNDFQIGAMTSCTNNTSFNNISSTVLDRFSYIYITSDIRSTSATNAGQPYTYIIKNSTGAYDNSAIAYHNGTYTSAIKMTEVTDFTASDAQLLVAAKIDALCGVTGKTFGTGDGEYSYLSGATLKTSFDDYKTDVNAATTVETVNLIYNSVKLYSERVVSSVDNLSNSKKYYIQCKDHATRGSMYYNSSTETFTTTNLSSVAESYNDEYQQFAIIKSNDKYYIYNVGAQEFMTGISGNPTLTSSAVRNSRYSFTVGSSGDDTYTWNIFANNNRRLNINTETPGIVFPASADSDGGNQLLIYEVGDFDAADALEVISTLENAESALAKAGKVGYPTTDCSATTNLTNAVTSEGGITSYLSDFKSETTNIAMPTEGSYYTITVMLKNGNARYMYFDSSADTYNMSTAAEKADNSTYPITAYLKCVKVDNGKYYFRNNAGYYFIWRGSGSSTSKGYNNNKGYYANEDANICSLTLAKLIAPETATTLITETDQKNLFGYMTITGLRYDRSAQGYFVATSDAYDGAGDPYYNTNYSSAMLIEEVDVTDKSIWDISITGTTIGKITNTTDGYTGTAAAGNGGFHVYASGVTPTEGTNFTVKTISGYSKNAATVEDNTISVEYTLSLADGKVYKLLNDGTSRYVSMDELWNPGAKDHTGCDVVSMVTDHGTPIKFTKSGEGWTFQDTYSGKYLNVAEWSTYASDESHVWYISDGKIAQANTGTSIYYGNPTQGTNVPYWGVNAQRLSTDENTSWTFMPCIKVTYNYVTSAGGTSVGTSEAYVAEGDSYPAFNLPDGYDYSSGIPSGTISSDLIVAGEDITQEILVTADAGKVTLWHSTPYVLPCYRIPAVTKTLDGSLVAFSDRRWCGQDVGWNSNQLKNDIVYRVKKAGSDTWTESKVCLKGTGAKTDSAQCAYGDAAVLTDRVTGKILVMTVAGSARYSSANRTTNLMRCVRTVYDYDATTGALTENTEDAYKQTEVTNQILGYNGTGLYKDIAGNFIGSGKLCQSKYIKVGTHYRVYAAIDCYNGGAKGNRVMYSDDLGATWYDLNSAGETAGSTPAASGDEPKIEELPDGRVLLSSRMCSGSGRYFNIFTYTTVPTAETPAAGTWSTVQNASSIDCQKPTNGEVMIVPATRKSDNKKVYVALQSVPTSSSKVRQDIKVYYKEFDPTTLTEVVSPTTVTGTWTEGIHVSKTTSAYSTMCLDKDNNIAFFYEENKTDGRVRKDNGSTYNESGNEVGYDMQFRTYTLSEMTGGAYEYDATSGADLAFDKTYMTSVVNAGTSTTGYNIASGVNNYSINSDATCVQFGKAMAATTSYSDVLTINQPTTGFYRIKNVKGNHYLGSTMGYSVWMSTNEDATTLYYIENVDDQLYLLAYNNGWYFKGAQAIGVGSDYKQLWTAEEGLVGQYTLKNFESKYLTGDGSMCWYQGTGKTDENGQWTFVSIDELPLTTNADGSATFSAPVPVTIPENKENDGIAYRAYYAAAKSDNVVSMTKVTGDIAANTGIIIRTYDDTNKKGVAKDLSFAIKTTGTELSGNKLTANVAAEAVSTTGHYFFGKANGAYSFVFLQGDTYTLGGHKCYLSADTPAAGARALTITWDGEDTPTNINGIFGESAETSADGKYIKDGKVVIVKNGVRFNAAGQRVY